MCTRSRFSHLHVGGPQSHAVGGQPQDDDYDVERRLKVLVHLSVHITERDVAHCLLQNTVCVCVCVIGASSHPQLRVSLCVFTALLLQRLDSKVSAWASRSLVAVRPSNVGQEKTTQASLFLIVPVFGAVHPTQEGLMCH